MSVDQIFFILLFVVGIPLGMKLFSSYEKSDYEEWKRREKDYENRRKGKKNWQSEEIDHKLPVSSFDKDTLPSIVNALDNLQPLWQSENRSKYNKY